MIALFISNLLLGANMHGKQKLKTENFWVTVVSLAINFILLYFGGFFRGI